MDKLVTKPLHETNQTNNFAYSVSLDGYNGTTPVAEGTIDSTATVVAPMIKKYSSTAHPSLYTPYRDVAFRGQLFSDAQCIALGVDPLECPIAFTTIDIDMKFKTNGFYSIGYFILENAQVWDKTYFIPEAIGAPMFRGGEIGGEIKHFFAIPQLNDHQLAILAYSDNYQIINDGAGLYDINVKVGFYGFNNV